MKNLKEGQLGPSSASQMAFHNATQPTLNATALSLPLALKIKQVIYQNGRCRDKRAVSRSRPAHEALLPEHPWVSQHKS